MFVYNDIFFGPYFRSNILPNMSENNPCILCCVSMCGIKLDVLDQEQILIDEDTLIDDNELADSN